MTRRLGTVRRLYEYNLGLTVIGWKRYLQLVSVFDREFNGSNITLQATAGGGKDDWILWAQYKAEKPPSASVVDNYRMFLRGAIAASMHYDPYGEK